MKTFQFIFISAFALLNIVYSQDCDSRGEMGIKQCYSGLMKVFNVNDAADLYQTFDGVNKDTLCKGLTTKSQCLGTDYAEKCLNVPTFSKVFGISNDDAFYVLYNDALYGNDCKDQYYAPDKDIGCLNNLDFATECQIDNDGCDKLTLEKLKNRSECKKKVSNEKCGNSDYAEKRYKSESVADEKMAQICGL